MMPTIRLLSMLATTTANRMAIAAEKAMVLRLVETMTTSTTRGSSR